MKIEFTTENIPDQKSDKGWCGLRIWQKPREGHLYALGVDVAEGVGKDASCIQVLDCNNGLLVANYWSNAIDVDNYAVEVYKLANYYNKAYVCVECNNHGIAVLSHLSGQLGGFSYPRLYKREAYDEFLKKKTKKVGFRTTTQTKPYILSNLKSALKSGDINMYDKFTVLELNTFVQTEKGKMGAQGGAKDDRVMALALAWEQARILQSRLQNSKQDRQVDSSAKSYDPDTGFPIF